MKIMFPKHHQEKNHFFSLDLLYLVLQFAQNTCSDSRESIQTPVTAEWHNACYEEIEIAIVTTSFKLHRNGKYVPFLSALWQMDSSSTEVGGIPSLFVLI